MNFLSVTNKFLNSKGKVTIAVDTSNKLINLLLLAKEVPRYSIVKPNFYPIITNYYKVEIYINNPKYTEKLKTILNKYYIYYNYRLIPILDKDKIRIKLLNS